MTSVSHTASPAATLLSAPQVVVAGLLAFAVAMGIGRFAFTPVLPLMLREGWVDLQGGGWLATLNYLGYFVGALSCMVLRFTPTRMVKWGLSLTIVLTLGMGVTYLGVSAVAHHSGTWHSLEQGLWLTLRFLSGVASAWTFVFASGWGLQTLSQLGRSQIGSLMFCGPGLGIMASGLFVALMVPFGIHAASAWIVLGLLALGLSAWIWRALRSPLPHEPNDSHASTEIVPAQAASAMMQALDAKVRRTLRWEVSVLAGAYGLAGFGYIITATFLPVMARQVLPHSALNDYFWPIFGASMAIGAWLAGRVAVTMDQRILLLISYLMQALGVWLTVILPNEWGFVFGCVLLGLPYTALVLFAMREGARLALRLGIVPSKLMGLLTALYGLGQILGPPLATAWVVRSGSFTPSLLFAAGSLLFGAAVFGAMVKIFPYAKST